MAALWLTYRGRIGPQLGSGGIPDRSPTVSFRLVLCCGGDGKSATLRQNRGMRYQSLNLFLCCCFFVSGSARKSTIKYKVYYANCYINKNVEARKTDDAKALRLSAEQKYSR